MGEDGVKVVGRKFYERRDSLRAFRLGGLFEQPFGDLGYFRFSGHAVEEMPKSFCSRSAHQNAVNLGGVERCFNEVRAFARHPALMRYALGQSPAKNLDERVCRTRKLSIVRHRALPYRGLYPSPFGASLTPATFGVEPIPPLPRLLDGVMRIKN